MCFTPTWNALESDSWIRITPSCPFNNSSRHQYLLCARQLAVFVSHEIRTTFSLFITCKSTPNTHTVCKSMVCLPGEHSFKTNSLRLGYMNREASISWEDLERPVTSSLHAKWNNYY
jgi:hypothetical protein